LLNIPGLEETPNLETAREVEQSSKAVTSDGHDFFDAPITLVRDQLRHSDVRMTLGIYGHVIGNSQRNAVNRLAKRLIV
jgi:hypothetical protein